MCVPVRERERERERGGGERGGGRGGRERYVQTDRQTGKNIQTGRQINR